MSETWSGITCYACGVQFYVPAQFHAARAADHKTFHCPNGHGNVFLQESEVDAIRRQLAEAQRELAAARKQLAEERERAERNWNLAHALGRV